MDVRSLQRPLKDLYRQDPASSRITLRARGTQTDAPISCSVDLGRAIYNAQAHQGVGGAGTGACSGDLLLGALAACAQITCQMVAAAMGIPTEAIEVTVEGDLDLQGTLGLSKEAPVGFQSIRVIFDVRAPQARKRRHPAGALPDHRGDLLRAQPAAQAEQRRDLRRRPRHFEIDDPFGLGGKMRLPRGQRVVAGRRLRGCRCWPSQQVRQGHAAEARLARLEKMPTRLGMS